MSGRRASSSTPRVTKPYSEDAVAGDPGRRRRGRRAPAGRRRAADHGRRADLRLDRRHATAPNGTRRPSGRPSARCADDLIRRLQRPLRAGRPAALRPGQVVSGRAAAALGVRALLARRRRSRCGATRPRRPREAEPAGATSTMPSASCCGLTERLGLDPNSALPAYEDPALFPASSEKLPVNLDPPTTSSTTRGARAARPRVRARPRTCRPATCCRSSAGRRRARSPLAQRALGAAARQAVPDARRFAGRASACRWARCPGCRRTTSRSVVPLDPFAAHAAAAGARAGCCSRSAGVDAPRRGAAAAPPASLGAVRTALAIEPRDGQLCVFMPPTESARGFRRARRRDRGHRGRRSTCRCMIEGYPPPPDARLNVIKVTPDPGVIEVNIHPAHELGRAGRDHRRRSTRRRARPASAPDKFMLDGRHTGTGGGNHIVLGGATPPDSPFLRRPDLLAIAGRLLAEPPVACRYLFSGLFIGPTSQAPRVDEARDDQLYELEIALAQVPDPGAGHLPALAGRPDLPQPADRRHRQHAPGRDLHRQALLARRPDRPARPGRVPRLRDAAARADEPRPAAAAARADRLVLGAALPPAAGPLGHRAARPLHAAALSSGATSRTSAPTCAAPACRSRPSGSSRISSSASRYYGDVDPSRRRPSSCAQALEPWHVLGEEGVVGGTARYVDSSLERAAGEGRRASRASRYAVTCNGRALPLQSTGTRGECGRGRALSRLAAAGLPAPDHRRRTRRWCFDLVDRWNRPLARRLHLPRHAPGRPQLREAAGQRATRPRAAASPAFEAGGHTPGPMDGRARPTSHPDFPHTLDLRRFG